MTDAAGGLRADEYEGREQAFVKHFVLEKYLEVLVRIVGTKWGTINYVDCFSGPWQEKGEALEGTSFGRALKALRSARDYLATRGRSIHLRCFFIEKERTAYERLRAFAEKQTGIDVATQNNEFENAVPNIEQFLEAGGRDAFTFLFIDPKGWTGYPLAVIQPLLRRPSTEVLINFMTSFIQRFVGMSTAAIRSSFEELYGTSAFLDDFQKLEGLDREDFAVEKYAAVIKAAGGFECVGRAVVLNPLKDKTQYHLIYATGHPKGLEKFKETEKAAMRVMEATRAKAQQDTREAKSNQYELLQALDAHRGEHYRLLRERYLSQARSAVQQLLRTRKRARYDEVWDLALSFQLVWQSDLNDWLKQWRAEQHLVIQGLDANAKTVQRGKGVALVWK